MSPEDIRDVERNRELAAAAECLAKTAEDLAEAEVQSLPLMSTGNFNEQKKRESACSSQMSPDLGVLASAAAGSHDSAVSVDSPPLAPPSSAAGTEAGPPGAAVGTCQWLLDAMAAQAGRP